MAKLKYRDMDIKSLYICICKDGIDRWKCRFKFKNCKYSNNTEPWIESKDTWLYIYRFDLSPKDEGYHNELIDPSELNGYVMNELIETELIQ